MVKISIILQQKVKDAENMDKREVTILMNQIQSAGKFYLVFLI